jgi:hypothetical protein
MKVIEISVTVLVPDDTTEEATRELVGSSVSEMINDHAALLDVSLLSSRTITDNEAMEMIE